MTLTLVQGTGGPYPGHNLVQEMTDAHAQWKGMAGTPMQARLAPGEAPRQAASRVAMGAHPIVSTAQLVSRPSDA